MTMARALPCDQPVRATTAPTSAEMSGDDWACPTVDQAPGGQATDGVVSARPLMLPVAVVNVAALSAACARIVRDVAVEPASSTAKIRLAAVMVDPRGIARLVK